LAPAANVLAKVCDCRTVEAVTGWQEVGERVRDVRLAHSLSQADLARRLELDRTAVVRIEAGERQVSALELGKLADVFRVPIAHFVTRSPVAVRTYRSPLPDDPDQGARDRLLLDIDLETHARDAAWLRDEGFPMAVEPPVSGSAGTPAEAAELARQARKHLQKPSGPLGSMAAVAECFGLYLLVVDRDASGASLELDVGFGVAVVGGRAQPGRRRWTAAHELAHHVLGDPYHSDVGVSASDSEKETVVVAFAAELLLPDADLQEAWTRKAASDPRRALIELSARYRLSWSATVAAAIHAGVLSKDEGQRLRAHSPLRGDFLDVVGSEPPEDLVVGTTGPLWRHAVLAAWRDFKVSAERAVELLAEAIPASQLPEREAVDVP
jgi:transcriptional regulator with XRE-family HTH domain/Zn-dependent peptidase ImmA (M78 family)